MIMHEVIEYTIPIRRRMSGIGSNSRDIRYSLDIADIAGRQKYWKKTIEVCHTKLLPRIL